MARDISPLRLGANVCFDDKWQGHVSSIDIAEDWEVLNFTVSSGFLFMSASVKLPFSTAKEWTNDAVFVSATSQAAFAREIPPVAAPSRPISKETPVGHPGTRISGLFVDPTSRKATEVLVSRGIGGRIHRIPVANATFDGKALALGVQFDTLPDFVPDEVLTHRVREAIAESSGIVSDDKLGIVASSRGGVLVLEGNTRTRAATERMGDVVSAVPGVSALDNQLVDDIGLETTLGLTLDREGASRDAEIFTRSQLGVVTLFGSAPTQRLIEDVTRQVARVKGVREVRSRVAIRPAA